MFKTSIQARSWEAALCVCRCTLPEAPEPYAAAPTQSTGDFPSPPSCILSPNPFSSPTAFCHPSTHEPIARVGFICNTQGTAISHCFPRSSMGSPRSQLQEIPAPGQTRHFATCVLFQSNQLPHPHPRGCPELNPVHAQKRSPGTAVCHSLGQR